MRGDLLKSGLDVFKDEASQLASVNKIHQTKKGTLGNLQRLLYSHTVLLSQGRKLDF